MSFTMIREKKKHVINNHSHSIILKLMVYYFFFKFYDSIEELIYNLKYSDLSFQDHSNYGLV